MTIMIINRIKPTFYNKFSSKNFNSKLNNKNKLNSRNKFSSRHLNMLSSQTSTTNLVAKTLKTRNKKKSWQKLQLRSYLTTIKILAMAI